MASRDTGTPPNGHRPRNASASIHVPGRTIQRAGALGGHAKHASPKIAE
jgi:hypothetical protein